jgi:hypothetical protein
MNELRKFLGAVGLLLVAIVGPFALIGLLVNEPAMAPLWAWTGLGLILWGQAVAAQAHLGFAVTIAWLIVFVGLALGIAVIAILVFAVVSAVVGTAAETRAIGLVVVGIATALIGGWAQTSPRRAATLGALRRAALARATAEDSRLLAAGPRAFFRPEATPEPEAEPVGKQDGQP